MREQKKVWVSLFAGALGTLASACGGTQSAPRPSSEGVAEFTVSAWVGRDMMIRELGVTETLFGIQVEDPYRALEEDSELTQAWIQAQNSRSQAALAQWPHEGMRERMGELLRIGALGKVESEGGKIFATLREGEAEQMQLFVLERASDGRYAKRLLLDPTTLGARASIDWFYASPRGNFISVGISENGDERSTLRVLRVSDGTFLSDSIPRAKWSSTSWLPDETGFAYSRYPNEGEAHWDESGPEAYFPSVFMHRIGQEASSDLLVFQNDVRDGFPSPGISTDGRHVVINRTRSWSASDVFVINLARLGQEGAMQTVVDGQAHRYTAELEGSNLFVYSNEDAPKGRIFKVSLRDASNRSRWREIIPQSEGSIEGWDVSHGSIVVERVENIAGKLSRYDLNGRHLLDVQVPGAGDVGGWANDESDGSLSYIFSNMTTAPTLFRSTFGRGAQTSTVYAVQSPIDLSQFEMHRESVPSTDGANVNVFLFHRRGLQMNGEQKVLLTAYGGFNISLTPGFQRNILYWVEQGGIFALANLRGGGEFGEEWHRAGNRENKHHVFEDMESVIAWLGGASGISNPSKIGIYGGSNGGLLMAAMLTRGNARVGAVATYVGLYDMLRFHHFPPANIWTDEYGSPEVENEFRWLAEYSPYQHIEDGLRTRQAYDGQYPPTWVETATHDTRVHWAHSTKLAARLQAATGGEQSPIYFYQEQNAGHGAGMRISDVVERYVRMMSFFNQYLGH